MTQKFILFALLSLFALPTVIRAAESPSFNEAAKPFFAKYCLRCHDSKKQEGEFRIDTLAQDFSSQTVAQRWGEVMFRINSGEMPPKKQPQPSAQEVGAVADWISTRINDGRAARMAKRGPVAHYRLSRDEYAHAVYDMFGVDFDPRMPGALNEDPRWHGYDRIGSMLSLSPSHVNRYFAAANSVLNRAFPTKQPKVDSGRRDSGEQRWLIFPGQLQGNFNVREPGLYRIRVQLSALPSFKGRRPRVSLWNNGLKRSEIGQDVIAPENKPTIIQFETFLPKGGFTLTNEAPGKFEGHTLSQTPKTITTVKEYQTSRPTGYKLFDDNGKSIFPLLLVDWLEYEGPILTAADKTKRDGLFPTDVVEASSCLNRFMERAWRRPVSQTELERYEKIVASELAAGENFRSAYLSAATGVLTSKNFYFIVEGTAGQTRADVNDWELASRLSFFLWSSAPDESLRASAEKGELHNKGILKSHLQRMMSDSKIQRFTDYFSQQWLQLHKVGMFPPDPELYPDYDKWLEQSMTLESTHFFAEVFERNMSIREFVTSDWTVLNSRLAMHYKMPQPAQSGFQRVQLQPENHRGGLLTHASVLSLTSDGTRHRPVHRGVWVSEAIFGKTPPPPPPNVEPLEPTPSDQPKATIRQQLEAHATHNTCASCHRKIDPLGFAFDNYDAIGQWRDNENVVGGRGDNPPINATGELPDGRKYSGPDEFKQLLQADIDRFAEAFVEQLATFALRRVMTINDSPQIKMIAVESKKDDYKLQSIIENLVTSELFRKR
ncbi:MAG: mono/diheme cytochrome c family protein [Pirellulaceae bacterium]|jgi:mono/diheme cytochrome c family protein